MAKTLNEKIKAAMLEKEQAENRIKELVKKQKEQDRADRTRRLCKRMGMFESMIPESVNLTDEQFKSFLNLHVCTAANIERVQKTVMDNEKAAILGSTTIEAKPAEIAVNKPPQAVKHTAS
jgi:hypothetical protein